MQISGLPVVPLQLPQNQRQDIAARVQRDVQRETNRNEDDNAQRSLEELRLQANSGQPRRAEASSEISGVLPRKQGEGRDLPLNTKRALKLFAENTPSPEQQLGIELAGIDTFV